MGGPKQISIGRMSAEKRARYEQAKAGKRRHSLGSGIDGEIGFHRIKAKIKKQPDRTIFQGEDNAAAVIIDNNPRRAHAGADFASRVALIAGINGRELREGVEVDVDNALHDAAGVYVVQRENPLEMFRTGAHPALADPNLAYVDRKKIPEYKARISESHVTAYADRIQLVARNGGVNIYAGGVDSHLSTGPRNKEALGVNLIYGNKVDEEYNEKSAYSLEPLVKGHKLEKALNELTKRQTETTGTQFEAELQMTTIMWVLAFHTHPAALFYTFPSIELMVTILLGMPLKLKGMLSTVTSYANTAISEINRSSITTDSFKSRWNKTN